MKAFAVALLGLAVTAPAMAGPYVSTKSEFKGDEDGYSKTVHQARLGYGWKLDNGIKPYAELGGGLSAADGAENSSRISGKAGIGVPVTDALSAYGELSFITAEDEFLDDLGVGGKLGVKYNF